MASKVPLMLLLLVALVAVASAATAIEHSAVVDKHLKPTTTTSYKEFNALSIKPDARAIEGAPVGGRHLLAARSPASEEVFANNYVERVTGQGLNRDRKLLNVGSNLNKDHPVGTLARGSNTMLASTDARLPSMLGQNNRKLMRLRVDVPTQASRTIGASAWTGEEVLANNKVDRAVMPNNRNLLAASVSISKENPGTFLASVDTAPGKRDRSLLAGKADLVSQASTITGVVIGSTASVNAADAPLVKGKL